MAFLTELGSRRPLKATETVDRSTPVLTAEGDAEAGRILRERVREVDIDQWHGLFAHLSPATVMVPMSAADGRLLQAMYAASARGGPALTAEQRAAAGIIEAALQAAVQSFGGVAWVKASSRSPKDATLATDALTAAAAALMDDAAWRAELGFAGDDRSDNVRVAALLQGSIGCMRIGSGADALRLLASSERIYEDIQLELDGAGPFSMSFVVREFVPMRAHLEFRAFVHAGRLTAVSQYNHICCYPAVAAARESLAARIAAFFADSVAPLSARLPAAYVIDFAVLADRLIVIELNPYRSYAGNGTDGCLFDWTADRAVIEAADGLAFRVREAPIPALIDGMNADARALLATFA